MVSAADRQLSLSVSPDTRMMYEAVNKCCHACTLHLWSNSVSMEHIYICFECFPFLPRPGTTSFWVPPCWSWVNSLAAFSICNPAKQPAAERGTKQTCSNLEAIQYSMFFCIVLFFREKIKFVPKLLTNFHLTQSIATFFFFPAQISFSFESQCYKCLFALYFYL